MDYAAQPLLFKLRKVLRYMRLYGVPRTYAKVRAQRHMKRIYRALPESRLPAPSQQVAIVGCGNYAYSTIAHFLTRSRGYVVGACMDTEINRAASLAQTYRVPFFTHDASALLALDGIDLVYIASNHASHAEYAIQALAHGKHVYIEKPHVINANQLDRLVKAMHTSRRKVFLGFNRPDSRLGELLRGYLGKEEGAGMYNWFVAGHRLDPDHWYFKAEEGGRVLGNLCHWLDFLLRLPHEPTFPIRIVPCRAEKSDCDVVVNLVFADGSIGVVTFSAKGHTFEGVSERFSAHRGDCLLRLDEFERLTVQVREKTMTYALRHRDHGHAANILRAYRCAFEGEAYDTLSYYRHVADTGWLLLKSKDALESNTPMTISRYPCAWDALAPESDINREQHAVTARSAVSRTGED